MTTVRDGMRVCFTYKVSLDNGEVIDSTEGGEPLCYVHGTGSIIPGLEQAMEGMSLGEARDVVVPAAMAYGERDPESVERLPRSMFPEEIDLGMAFRMMSDDGQPTTVYVETIEQDWVEVNWSHPLAGEDLHFSVEITELREATDEDYEACCGSCDCGGCGGECDDEEGCGCGHCH